MIKLDHISKSFGDRLILDNISVEIPSGKIFTIIGPSGQGKTTLMRLINLLDTPSSGQIIFNGTSLEHIKNITEIRRQMGMVFQTPIAFNETVYANLAMGLKFRGVSKDEIKKRVEEKINEIGLSGYEHRKARTLSGGEMQRVSLARVMITNPDLLLLDEPTANLDPVSTAKIEELIRYYNRTCGTTVIMSSHDLYQGQRLADIIAVMMGGRFVQSGETNQVFSEPCSADVARFIGIRNILPGVATQLENGLIQIDLGGIIIYAVSSMTEKEVMVAIRPEEITVHTNESGKTSARNVLTGIITEIEPYGIINHVLVSCNGIILASQVTLQSVREMNLRPGLEVQLSFKAPSVHLMSQCPGYHI
ncbi:ABC transporter ATP-binding protein [Methanospirillum lacunae]|uniref:Molybdate/tungstate import ATP-binding protein WtpC n=1 Tax=Methanospirillum lacunae TaxID=668570 RepID=A0A2V2N2H6_9EURY|nr:ABC transporter ATP-binding protein [Methanospirillum lacunae]PWR69661.1 ABC transporter ATP-binding protein [Methanospirillum lacunae]